MTRISRDSLMTLEAYAKARPEFRSKVMAHKKSRIVALGDHITLIFEDELTVRYQIQEMLRVEKSFEEAGIMDELEAYGPLVPDGSNWKATMMIEYPDPVQRAEKLRQLKGIEKMVYIQVQDCDRVHATADEDLERENEEKTSAVHFLRFELSSEMAQSVKRGAAISVGVEHPAYTAHTGALPSSIRDSLAADIA
ncbi:MAG TPA: DUF3501 family protein [Thiobacillaceae bacterium]|nr:DUF3501 family protein [Thiobacillaceae bacterium]